MGSRGTVTENKDFKISLTTLTTDRIKGIDSKKLKELI